jgi:hypothetical protein
MFNKKQEEVLLKTKLFESYLVNIKRNMSPSSSQKDVTGHILNGMSDEIKICLDHQFISKAGSLIWKRDGKQFPFQTMFLTFKFLKYSFSMGVHLFAHTFQTLWGVPGARGLDTSNNGVLRVCGNCSDSRHGEASTVS